MTKCDKNKYQFQISFFAEASFTKTYKMQRYDVYYEYLLNELTDGNWQK